MRILLVYKEKDSIFVLAVRRAQGRWTEEDDTNQDIRVLRPLSSVKKKKKKSDSCCWMIEKARAKVHVLEG